MRRGCSPRPGLEPAEDDLLGGERKNLCDAIGVIYPSVPTRPRSGKGEPQGDNADA